MTKSTLAIPSAETLEALTGMENANEELLPFRRPETMDDDESTASSDEAADQLLASQG